jgi:uncharacterized protein (DUF58 family)
MFNSTWFYSSLWLLIVASLLGSPSLAAISMLILLTAGMAWLWNRASLQRVGYERTLSETRVSPGETVTLTVRVANRKALPLAWLEALDEFPARLPLVKGKVVKSINPLVAVLGHAMALRWYERLTWRYEVLAAARGYYAFGPVTFRSGDPFGFFESSAAQSPVDHLIVYPRIVALDRLGIPTRQPFGEVRSQERIFEDVSRTIGIRDWQQGDDLHRIHWKATARRQSLQVRVFEPSSTLNVAIFLNVATLPETWEGSDPELLEEAIVVAASLANYGLESRCQVGLYANTSLPESDQPIRIPPGRKPGQLTTILEALAKVTAFPIAPLELILATEAGRLPWGSTVVVVSAIVPEGLLAGIIRLRDAGHRITLAALTDKVPTEALRGVQVFRPTIPPAKT